MTCRLTWIGDPRLSTIYALRSLIARRPFIDQKLCAAWRTLVERTHQLDLCEEIWRGLQVGGTEAESSLSFGTSKMLADADAAMHTAHPRLAEEIALRQGPLRERWEAHGPGLLLQMTRAAQLTLPPDGHVVTVLPIHGGGGEAIAEHNAVVIESVLANPIAELPEILRLAWLIAQLSAGSDAASLIPICLAAARELGIVGADLEEKAHAAWLPVAE